MSVLIWVQIVSKVYQQTTKESDSKTTVKVPFDMNQRNQFDVQVFEETIPSRQNVLRCRYL